jgi:enoyl reductase-like protein
MNRSTYIVIQVLDGNVFVAHTHDIEEPVATVIDRASETHELYQIVSEPDDADEAEQAAPICEVHQVPMVLVQGKKGPFWSCHERVGDGWCKYRPPQKAA